MQFKVGDRDIATRLFNTYPINRYLLSREVVEAGELGVVTAIDVNHNGYPDKGQLLISFGERKVSAPYFLVKMATPLEQLL